MQNDEREPVNANPEPQGPGLAGMIGSGELPDIAGFFWWRKSAADAWRMVQVINFGDDGDPHLMTYDVQHNSWSGRTLINWAEFFPVGEWQQVTPPNIKMTDADLHDGRTHVGVRSGA